MKKWFLVLMVTVAGLAFASYDSEASAYETVVMTESYGSTGATAVTYASSGTAFIQRQPVRRVLRSGRNIVRGTVRVATSPIRAVGTCR